MSKVSASVIVKLTLFKTSCMSMYDLCLWKHYSVTDFLTSFDRSIINVSRSFLVTLV